MKKKRRPWQSIHSLVVGRKKSGFSFTRKKPLLCRINGKTRDNNEVSCVRIPDLHGAIDCAGGSNVLSAGGPGDGCHRSSMAVVREKRSAENPGLRRRWSRWGTHRGSSNERVRKQHVYHIRLFNDECRDSDTDATRCYHAEAAFHKGSPLDHRARFLSRPLGKETL